MTVIEVEQLTKEYNGKKVVDQISFQVKKGEIFAFLGPNGAGKSTMVQMLTTLISVSSGHATINEYDIQRDQKNVRLQIGVALQETGIDNDLTGRELLVLQGKLFGFSQAKATTRATELLELVGLSNDGNRRAGKYSGGMKRRLDLALTLVHQPAVLFLDEPTTGLDPASRQQIWTEVRRLNEEYGTTIFLTTQYLEEADQLADRIAIINEGKLIAEGTATELKAMNGAERIEVVLEDDRATEAFRQAFAGRLEKGMILLPSEGTETLKQVVRYLDEHQLTARSLVVKQPSLDDVFIQLTGQAYKEEK
ncbi:ATP-binding cassette domain-containing protein [Exiguobacterium antarcticum]|uniref:ATP-binding cassette domain-containing protein n=1 Tax=Exiguobacterium antarcticum TaxID=132920 RepID=UPI000687BF67|nr:ATP-binding cassette domain-containing protein [Exiguobacterium antarcticum]